MVYEKVFELDDFLAHAWLKDNEATFQDYGDRTLTIDGKPIPFLFNVDFFIKNKSKTWRTTFHLRVPENDSVELISIQTFGEGELPIWYFEKLKDKSLKRTDIDELIRRNELRPHFGVKRFQSEFVAKYQTQLVDRAVLIAIQYLATKSNVVLSGAELKGLTRQIKSKSRRKVTPALLKQVAVIYKASVSSYPKGDPILEIMDAFTVSHRRAQEYAQLARKEKFLESPEKLRKKQERKGK
jgi:hypothetical protein